MRLLVVALLLAVVPGCGNLVTTATHPSMIAGSDVVELVDLDAGLIAARHPAVPIGPARCPLLLNLSGGATGECTIAVAGRPMRIGVRRESAAFLALTDLDVPVFRREIERRIATAYGTDRVRCGDPPVEIVPAPFQFTCYEGTYGRPVAVYVTRRDGEASFRGDQPGRPWPSRRMLGDDVAGRTTGSMTISGPVLERYLRASAEAVSRHDVRRRNLLGAARCPARVMLAPGRHAACTVRLGTRDLRFDLRFDEGRGFVAEPLGTVVIADTVRDPLQRAYAHARSVEGKRSVGTVSCGNEPVWIVEPGEAGLCRVDERNEPKLIVVDIVDAEGRFELKRILPLRSP